MAPVITIVGPIGSGKTLQAELLAAALKWRTFSTGQLLRDHSNEPHADPEVVRALRSGTLASSSYVQDLVLRQVKAVKEEVGIILDGSPRKVEEAQRYDQEFPKLGRIMSLVVFLDTGRPTVEQRLAKRGRDDDQPETVKVRWAAYERDTVPMVQYYRDKGMVVDVDGHGDPEQVHGRILEALRGRNLA